MARNAEAFEVEWDSPRNRGAGAYSFLQNATGENVGIVHACPCGCGGRSAITFRGKGTDGHQEWDVTGEWPKVTLAPSIGIKPITNGAYHWHGFLENGVFVER
jgi:hypothetical protein